MACYYKVNESENPLPIYKGFHLQKVKKFKGSGPKINYDFSKHVLIELLDDSTPESKLWSELGLTNNKNVVHKRIMLDSHRIKCRRAIVVCVNSDEAKQLAERISQTEVMTRCVCAVVIQDLLADLCLFEKQIIQFGDSRPQQQLLYISDLNRCREPSGLIRYLKEKFSPFGTILSVLVCPDKDGYAYPEGVIKFAFLSEAFAAELAMDQNVVGMERLSVTAHHNILLSQCDLRVRLRDAQWLNNAERNAFSEASFNSYELNNLSTVDEDPILKSIDNLQISSQNTTVINKESKLIDNNVSVSYPEIDQCPLHVQHEKSKLDDLSMSNKSRNAYNSKMLNSGAISESNKNIVYNVNDNETNIKGNILNSNSFRKKNIKISNLSYINSANVSSSEKFHLESKINSAILQGSRVRKNSKIISDSGSFISCSNGPDPQPHSSQFSARKTILSSFHSDDLRAVSEYYSMSSDCKELSSVHNDSENNVKHLTSNSKKRRKHFTPSQKLCLKSQRIGSSQSAAQTSSPKSEISNSNSSHSSKSKESNEINCRKNQNLHLVTSRSLNFLPVDPGSSKVTSWLSHLPKLQSTVYTHVTEQNFNIEVPSNMLVARIKKHKNRISVLSTPSLKLRTIRRSSCDTNSDNSSVENEDPNEKSVTLSNEDCAVLQIEKFQSPLQAWLKQELMSSINNSVIKSEETSKSIIVCAAKTKDVIISVGCSHMTCDFCYPSSTDLLLGYS